MKNSTTLVLFMIFLLSCGKETTHSDSRDCQEVEYETSFDMLLDDEVCFPDGNSLTLSKIEHRLCPCNAICKWEGGILITLFTTTKTGPEEIQIYALPYHIGESVFDNHQFSSISYTYDSVNGEVPPCEEDFVAEKIKLALTISKI